MWTLRRNAAFSIRYQTQDANGIEAHLRNGRPEYDEAISALEAVQKEFPRGIRPKQLRALALNRRARDGGSEEGSLVLLL